MYNYKNETIPRITNYYSQENKICFPLPLKFQPSTEKETTEENTPIFQVPAI